VRYRLLLHLSRFTEFCDISVTRSTGMEQLSQSAQVLVQMAHGQIWENMSKSWPARPRIAIDLPITRGPSEFHAQTQSLGVEYLRSFRLCFSKIDCDQ
jgi:hypothetical protein